jgi:hypothetical protein
LTLFLDGILIFAGPLAASTGAASSQLDPVEAYLEGSLAISSGTIIFFASSIFVIISCIAMALLMEGKESLLNADTRNTFWGNWWLLLIIPAMLGNYFDFFVGHLVFMLIFIVFAYMFYAGKDYTWRWSVAVGTFIAIFYMTDGTGDLIRGGPWNQSGITLSSPAVTHTAWGLLAFSSDFMVAMALLPLVYTSFIGNRGNLLILLIVSTFLVTVPRLALLPLLGFQTVFSGWPSLLSDLGDVVALLAIPLVWRSKRVVGSNYESS